MTSEADEASSTLIYELTCNDCAFEATVEGTVYEALDLAKAHREDNGDRTAGHFVDFELDDER